MFNKIKEMFDKHPEEDEVIETIEEIMDEREERGEDVLVDKDEMLLLKNMFKLRDKRACDVVLPRGEICAIPVNAKPEEVKKIILRDKYTRLPVYDKTLDNIIGILHTKDVLYALLKQKPLNILDIMNRHVLFIAPSMRALDLLRTMQAKGSQMAVVVDEFGGCMGLITLEDLLEEIVGEIRDEYDSDEEDAIEQLSEYEYMVLGSTNLDDVNDELEVEFESDDYDTIGGYCLQLLDHLPEENETLFTEDGCVLKIMEVDKNRIERIYIRVPEKTKEEE